MMMGAMDAKKKALEELMGYLDGKDSEELGSAMKPKGAEIDVTKVKKIGDDGKPMDLEGSPEEESSESPSEEASEDGSSPKMSDEELEELIQAIQSKLG